MLLLGHALLVDASEDGALEILIMAQIALDCLTQKARAAHALLAHCHVNLFEHALWQIEQYGSVVSFVISQCLSSK